MAKPLTAITKDGCGYSRRPDVETEIDRIIGQPLEIIRQRLRISAVDDPDRLSSECILHLLRAAFDGEDRDREALLYERLMRRIERLVYSKTDRGHAEELFFAVADEFNRRLVGRASTLDYYEVNFNAALTRSVTTHMRSLRRHPATVEFSETIEKPDEASTHEETSARTLDVAMALDRLSPMERKVYVLVKCQRYKEGSKNRLEPTAATLCGISPRMVRYYLASAKSKLAAALENYQP